MKKFSPALIAAAVAGALLLAACEGGGEAGSTVDRDTLTRDQRDSIIGESVLPGAGGVQGARRARDQANARTERHDSTSPREE